MIEQLGREVAFGARQELALAEGARAAEIDQHAAAVFAHEHVGGREAQTRFAREVMRTGRGYWVQTPNRWFPLEPHLLTPIVHWLPRKLQRAWVTNWTVWDWVERPSPDRRQFYIRHFLEDIRLLSASELAALFPDAEIHRERSFGLTKSLIATK